MVKKPPIKQEIWVQSLGREDPLEKKMATYSRILAWEIPWTEHPSWLVHGVAKNQTRLSDLTAVVATELKQISSGALSV